MNDPFAPEAASVLRRLGEARPEPPHDLWARIETAHAKRVAGRRRHRLISGSVLGVALIGVIAFAGLRPSSVMPNRGGDVDWQARAQALELQLQALRGERGAATAAVAAYEADPAAIELDDIDHRLQVAYENGMYTNELVPLWKRRSELLDTLIAARKQGLKLTRI